MRIGIDIRHLCAPNPSGVDYYSIELISRLIENTDIEFTLFASGSARNFRHIPAILQAARPNVTLHLLRIPNRLLNLKLLFDRVLLDDLIATPIDAWFFPNINFIRTQKPYVITAHDLSFEFLPNCYGRKTRLWHKLVQPKRLYKEARRVLAVSQSTATDLQSVYEIAAKKIVVTPLAADDAFTAHAEPSDHHTLRKYGVKVPYLLMLSTIEPRKNHAGAIAAYERWRQTGGARIPLVIAGKRGYQSRRIARAIRRSPFKDDIKLIGYVAHEDRPTLMRHATMFLFPSLYEGFALPVCEAIQSGVPVLTGNTSAMMEHTSSTILHVSPWHIEAMADGIAQLLLLLRSPKVSGSMPTWDETAARTQEAFHACLP